MYRPAHRRARARHHLLLPAIASGVLCGTALATLPSAAAAMSAPDITAISAISSVARDSSSSLAAAVTSEPRTGPQDVLSGVELVAKPPPPPPWQLPVNGYELTGRFGAASSLWSTTHTGLDFAAPEGAPIRSVGSGVVTETGSDGAFGNKTVVRLGDGTMLWYCHQSSVDVSVGDRVLAGQVIGAVGSTGNVTGAHLHLEVHRGAERPVDPEAWLAAHGLPA